MNIIEYYKKHRFQIEQMREKFIDSLPNDFMSDTALLAVAAFSVVLCKVAADKENKTAIEVIDKLTCAIDELFPYFIKETQE